MNLERPQEESKNIAEQLTYLKLTPEEAETFSKMSKAKQMLNDGDMDGSIAIMTKLRENKPKEREFTPEQEQEFEEVRAELVEKLGYKVQESKGRVLKCEKDGYAISMEHFMLPGIGGYQEGRVEEVFISKENDELLHIDGEVWDVEPEDEKVRKMFDELVAVLN